MNAPLADFDRQVIWFVIIALGIGSFALRFMFLGLIGDRPLPAWVLRHLRYTAVAVIPALVAPLVLWPPATGGETDPARLGAAAVTLAVGLWTKNLLVSVICGVATLYSLLYFVG